MKYQGSCHCGRVAFEAEGDIDSGLDCNCSMCRRRGGLLWFIARDKLRLTTPVAQLGTYSFNTHRLQHHFCPTCGIATFSEGKDQQGVEMAAVNLRCLDGVDLAAVKIVHYDGRNR